LFLSRFHYLDSESLRDYPPKVEHESGYNGKKTIIIAF